MTIWLYYALRRSEGISLTIIILLHDWHEHKIKSDRQIKIRQQAANIKASSRRFDSMISTALLIAASSADLMKRSSGYLIETCMLIAAPGRQAGSRKQEFKQ